MIRRLIVLGLVMGLLAAVAVATTPEAVFALVFGWVSFLGRVLPRVSVDVPGVALGCVAAALFIGGVQWAGAAWRRGSTPAWKWRWSLAVAVLVFLLFAAGISLVGAVHQVGWLLTSDRPLVGEGLGASRGGRSENNLKQIGIAVHNYEGANGTFPPGGTFSADGAMRHGWETYLLPYLGYSVREIDMGRAWNDPANEKYFKSVLPEFINPGFRTPALTDADGFGLSHYAANVRVLGGGRPLRPADITDGTSTTLLAGEVNGNFRPWGHPANWRDPARGVGRSPYGFGGPAGAGGANFVMADGSVRFVSDRVSPSVLRALSTPAGGEEVGSEALEDPR